MSQTQFEKWLAVASKVSHSNGKNKDDLYMGLTKYLVEHVMTSLIGRSVLSHGGGESLKKKGIGGSQESGYQQ